MLQGATYILGISLPQERDLLVVALNDMTWKKPYITFETTLPNS